MVDEETQTQGTYVVGAVATEETDGGDTARLTVYGSSSLIDASLTESFSNLDNLDLFLASATTGFEDVSSISIEPVSLVCANQPPSPPAASGACCSSW